MKLMYHVMSSPVGLLFLARGPHGLRYLQFMDRKSLKRMIAAREAENPDASWEPSLFSLKPVVEELEQYFSGDRFTFTQPRDPVGTEFQRQVWAALSAIPYGETRSYGDIARAIGQPRASRAVGLANNQNPIAIVIPCHRVIGSAGALVGYGGGLPRKKWLLDHEARFAAPVGRTVNLFTSARAGGALVAAPAARAPAPGHPAGPRTTARASATRTATTRAAAQRTTARASARASSARGAGASRSATRRRTRT